MATDISAETISDAPPCHQLALAPALASGDLASVDVSATKVTINDVVVKQFIVGSIYDSLTHLLETLVPISLHHGFYVIREGMKIVCNWSGMTSTKKIVDGGPPGTKRRKTNNWMKVDCQFKVGFAYTCIPTRQEKNEGKKRTIDTIRITSVCGMHCALCNPGKIQAVHVLRAAGRLSMIEKDAMVRLINLVNTSVRVPADVLRN
jgi:hypothetical protein